MRPILTGLNPVELHFRDFEFPGKVLHADFSFPDFPLDDLHLVCIQLLTLKGPELRHKSRIFLRMFDLHRVCYPFQIAGFVVFFLVIQMDDKVVPRRCPGAEVSGDQPVYVVVDVLPRDLDRYAWVSLGESGFEDCTFINAVCKTGYPAVI